MQVDIEKIIPVTEARDSFNKIVDEVEGSDELYVLTKNGKPAAVVVGVNHLEKLTGESEMEVMAKVDSKPEVDDAAPATGGTTLRPFQINNYDGETADTAGESVPRSPAEPEAKLGEVGPTPSSPPTAPADTSVTPPAPAPTSAPDISPTPAVDSAPATPDASTPTEPTPAPEAYDPFKIPEDTPADTTADTSTPRSPAEPEAKSGEVGPDPMSPPPSSPADAAPASPANNTTPPPNQAM